MDNISIKKALTWATKEFEKQNIGTAQLDAEVLLAHLLNCSRVEVYLKKEENLSPAELDQFNSLVARRVRREPIAYILGYKEFWSCQIKVTPDVLIPRPETEGIVDLVIARPQRGRGNPGETGGLLSFVRNDKVSILDLCTGSGCIAAALATELPQAKFCVTDISEKALAVAKENLAFASDRVTFFSGNLFEPIDKVRSTTDDRQFFDLIVSNPPYVSKSQWQDLADDIRKYEPIQALVAESEGLAISQKILEKAANYLKPGATLIMEIGIGQAGILKEYAASLRRYQLIEIRKDLAGIGRYLICRNFPSLDGRG
ncbi:MAG: peptide chain release factor N(5)-glutamine methyltransferase [Pseudomonadota bacterium]